MKRVYPPSMQAVIEFRTGDPDGLGKILKTWFWRSVILSAGLYAFSDKKNAVKNGVISATIIEAYLLYYFNKERSKRYMKKMNGCDCNGKQRCSGRPQVRLERAGVAPPCAASRPPGNTYSYGRSTRCS